MNKFLFFVSKISHGNDISNNIVDEDVQSLVLPFNIIQYIMFCPKYRIKNNCVTPNSLFSNFVSLVGTLAFISMFIYRHYVLYAINHCMGYTALMCSITFVDCIYYCFGFAMNFVFGVIYTNKSVNFVLIFQKVHRILNNRSTFRRSVIINWIGLMSYLGGYIFAFTYFCVSLSFEHMFNFYLLVFFDLNTICAIRGFNLLEDKIAIWNNHLLLSQDAERAFDPNNCKIMLQAYFDLLECYKLHRVCFQQFVSITLTGTETCPDMNWR